MVRIFYRHASGTIVPDLPLEQLADAIQDGNAHIWVDLLAPTQDECLQILENVFQFHPLAIEDVASSLLVPKVNDYRRYLYIVIHSIYTGSQIVDLISSKMDIFLGANFLVTIHEKPMMSADSLWDEEYHEDEGLAKGPAFLLYELLERQADRFMRLLDSFEAELERLGDVIFLEGNVADENLLDEILTAKSSALRLGRVLRPQRDLMNRLSNTDYAVIPGAARVYFADIYDHLVRMVGLVEGMQELARSTVDIYLALANNHMNEIMKVLTVISTIFIPLTFLTGVYGMNFRYMPELDVPWAYPVLWILFIIISLVLLRVFRRWKWL